MALRSGLAAQVGIAAETTFATYETVTRFLELTSEGLALSDERIEGSGIRPGNQVLRNDRWEANRKGAGGDLNFEVTSKGFGLVFEHMLGSIATANPATGVYTHTATLGDLTGKSLTAQVGKPGAGGTVHPFSYLGCKVASWELGMEVDGILTLALTLDAVDEDTTTGLETASYASSDELLVFTGATVTIGGSSVDVRSFSVSGDNALATDRYFLRDSSLKREQYQAGYTELTGSLEMDFEDLTEYNRFKDGTEAEIVATFEGTTVLDTGYVPHVKVTLPACRFDGDTPTVGGMEILTQSLPFKVLNDGSNEPITIEYQTADTTA